MAFHRLPTYRRWTNRLPSGGPKPDAYQTVVHMEEHGFPERVAQAFLQTANDLKSAILTRVPGKAATALIDDGYCLKSFYIHAKSCNWGPMAGFVAFFPALNKKGVSNIAFNQNAHLETLAKFENLKDKNTALPFVPLGLTERAYQSIENDLKTNGYFSKIDDKSAIGIVFDPNRTVLMEYLLQSQPADIPGYPKGKVFYVFHRNIYIKQETGETYVAYINDSTGKLTFRTPDEGKLTMPATVSPFDLIDGGLKKKLNDYFEAGWTALKAKGESISVRPPSSVNGFYPIHVAQNPYRTYEEGDPRNAITGDYDLFSVWPVGVSNRWGETIRLAEGRKTAPPPDFCDGVLFVPIVDKHFSLQLVHAPNVYVEVIPTFKEIKGLEDPVLGNINDAVYLAAGMLNAVVYKKYGQKPATPNVAFHSDEGGRPEVFEIEFPIAAFLPAGIKLPQEQSLTEYTTTTPRGLVITNASEFMDLVTLLEVQANIPLAHGWLIHLLILAAQNSTLEELLTQASEDKDRERGEKREKYLKARKDEADTLPKGCLDNLHLQIQSLLTGYDFKDGPKKMDADQVTAQAIQETIDQAMDQAAKVFFGLLYSPEDAYPKMTKIWAITMKPPDVKATTGKV